MRHRGSLGPAFASSLRFVGNKVRLAFALTLNSGVLTRLSQPLGPPDAFLGGYRPSQTAHLPVSPKRVRNMVMRGWCPRVASTFPGEKVSMAPTYTVHSQPCPNDRLQ